MLALVSLLYAVVPVLLYLWIVWNLDRYDREPIGLLLVNFSWGIVIAVAMVLAGLLPLAWNLAVAFSPSLAQSYAQTAFERVVAAPIVEEILKGAALLWVVRIKQFDNMTDGLVYGIAIGLGFGMTENFFYFMHAASAESWAARVLERTLFTVIMHATVTGLVGGAFGATKFGVKMMRWPVRIMGLLAAMAMHSFWNLAVSNERLSALGVDVVFVLIGVAVIIALFQLSLLGENRLLIRELASESDAGLIPALHLQYLPFSTKRKLVGWLPPSIDKKQYIVLTTRLAFRRHQLRYCKPNQRTDYQNEIDSLRNEITVILERERNSAAARLY